jgi:energy-coupling factor transporter ATP-binding protein EcfA2
VKRSNDHLKLSMVSEVKRVKLRFADIEVEFADREAAIRRVEEWAERGTYPVQVIYGPEGCGKTAWLKQSTELLKGAGYDVIYVDPLHREFLPYTDLKDFVKKFSEVASESLGVAQIKLATLAIDFVKYALKMGRRRVAILVDDVFQAIGLDKASTYVKSLLNLLEYPPREYEAIVVIVTTSEGVTRDEIGRHRWAQLLPMWNMVKEGFRELFRQVQGKRMDFEDVWRITGGNPGLLLNLYKGNWNVEDVIRNIVTGKKIKEFIVELTDDEKIWLKEAIKDPDTLFARERIRFLKKLVKLNLIIDDIPERIDSLWIDTPPPEKDLELGIGKHVAWQTPLHREAIRKALEERNK